MEGELSVVKLWDFSEGEREMLFSDGKREPKMIILSNREFFIGVKALR